MPYDPNRYSNKKIIEEKNYYFSEGERDSDDDEELDSSSSEEEIIYESRTGRQSDYVGKNSKKLKIRKKLKEPKKALPQNLLPKSGQEPMTNRSAHPILWHHGADKTGRGYGMEAISQANIDEAVPLESKVINASIQEGDPYQTTDKREGLKNVGIWETPYGEKIVLFEERPPPPTTDKYKLTEAELSRTSNPRLVYAQGGIDINAPIRHKKEVYNPAPTRNPNPEQERARQEEHMKSRQGVQVFMNRNGERGFFQQKEGNPLNFNDTINYVYEHMASLPTTTTREESQYYNPGQSVAEPGAAPREIQQLQRDLERTGHYYSGDNLGNTVVYDYKPFGDAAYHSQGSVAGQTDDRAMTQRTLLTGPEGNYYTNTASAQNIGGGGIVSHDNHYQNHTDRRVEPLLPEYMGEYAITLGSRGPEQGMVRGSDDHIQTTSGAQQNYDPSIGYAENTSGIIYSSHYDPLARGGLQHQEITTQGSYAADGSEILRQN